MSENKKLSSGSINTFNLLSIGGELIVTGTYPDTSYSWHRNPIIEQKKKL